MPAELLRLRENWIFCQSILALIQVTLPVMIYQHLALLMLLKDWQADPISMDAVISIFTWTKINGTSVEINGRFL